MALSKRLRFEIFKRDGFICQYCGNRPPDVVLEVDHIDPRSKGGSDDPINLITSCADCNRGKSDKVLSQRAVRPDADLEYLAAQQEIAEAQRFLQARAKLDELNKHVVAAISSYWEESLQIEGPPVQNIREWLTKYSPDEIIEAIDKFLPALRRKPHRFRFTEDQASYVGGILRNRRQEGGSVQ